MIGQKGVPATWGGVENHVEHLSKRLVSFGHDVVAYTRPYYVSKQKVREWNRSENGLRLVSLPTVRTKHLDAPVSTLLATVHAMIFENPDMYHFHSVGPSLFSFLPRIFRPSARVVTTFHSPDRLHSKWGWFAQRMLTLGEWTALKFAHKTITVSRDLQGYAEKEYGMKPAYIPNGIDQVENIQPSMITAEFGLAGEDYALVAARLVSHKGVHYLIDAWKQLDTEKKLVIAGDSTFTDEYVQQLHAQAAGDDRIIFAGFQTGQMMKELFSNAYLYVQPSESEGLSVAVLEAAAYGRAILASDIPANAEVVKDRGFLFENTNVADLTAQLETLLADPARVQEAGKRLRSHAYAEYHWSTIAQNTSALYESLKPVVREAHAHAQYTVK